MDDAIERVVKFFAWVWFFFVLGLLTFGACWWLDARCKVFGAPVPRAKAKPPGLSLKEVCGKWQILDKWSGKPFWVMELWSDGRYKCQIASGEGAVYVGTWKLLKDGATFEVKEWQTPWFDPLDDSSGQTWQTKLKRDGKDFKSDTTNFLAGKWQRVQ